jgi:hypothetical protein
MRTWWIAAVLLLPATVSIAQEKAFVAIHGFDKMSCDDWFGSEGSPDVRQQYIGWIRGVVTGYNYANPRDQVFAGRMPTDFGLAIFVDNYCHSKRATSISGAAFALIADRRGSSELQVIDDKPTPKDNTAKNAATSDGAAAGDAAASVESPGFHDWLARQSADIKSLGVELQRSIYKKEMSLKGN